jgi:hypothetical protein
MRVLRVSGCDFAARAVRQQPKRKFDEQEDELDMRLRRPQLEALGGYSPYTHTTLETPSTAAAGNRTT